MAGATSSQGRAMVPLTTVGSVFEGKVLVARLGADGILAELRGAAEGPYPLPGTVDVLVEEAQLGDARILLLSDEVEAAFEPEP